MRAIVRHRDDGFTLIEVLVALLVMAIMSLMAWRGVDGIVRTREANQVRLEQTLRLQTVIAQWEQDLAALQSNTGVADAAQCDGKSVRLIRHSDNGVQVVVWSLVPGDSGSTWQRWAGPAVTTTTALRDSWISTLQFQGDEPGQLRALRGLEEWQVYFYRGNSWSNCQSSAGTGVASALSGVRIVLSFAPGNGLSGKLVRDVVTPP